jgi:hypothetical protein
MLDRAWRVLFRNFSTFFLVVAVVAIPLHLAHAFLFRDVIAVQELHPDIEELPQDLRVRGVGADDVSDWRTTAWAFTALELALLPLFLAATRRVIEVDQEGGVPGVLDAYRHVVDRRSLPRPSAGDIAGLGAALVLGLVIGGLARAAGLLAIEPLGDARAWAGAALVEGAARALGAGFFLVPLGFAADSPKGAGGDTPTLY